MQLLSLELFQFRNHASTALKFESSLQLFVGSNAQGKTNLVEAIYVLGTGRSFRRNAQTKDMISHGIDEAAVRGSVLRSGLTTDLEVRLGRNRRLRVNGNDVSLLREYVNHLRVVAFHPEDLIIVRGGPDGRRDFVDRAAFTLYPDFLDGYTRYQRALAERNHLLKRHAGGDELAAWTEELAITGSALSAARARFLETFISEAVAAFGEIFGDVALGIRYSPSPASLLEHPTAGWADILREEFAARETDDRARGFTSTGPHRDDVSIELDGREARTYASQGQTRALALAFRVAQIRHAQRMLGESPVFILDDVGSELDARRRGFLADFLAASPVQAFITATDRGLLPALEARAETWVLEAGRVRRV